MRIGFQIIRHGTLEEQRYETLVSDKFIHREGQPEKQLLERDLKGEIAKALSALPPEYRERPCLPG